MFFKIELPVFNTNAINLGFISIKWYSLAYVFGLIFAWKLIKYFNTKYNLKLYTEKEGEKEFCDDFFLYGVLGIILGGRIIYVLFYHFFYYLNNPFEIFALWHGGMSFHGGFIGVLVGSFLLCKKHKINFFSFTDVLAVVVPIGLFLGRIANFINQELYGRATNGNWGVIFPSADNILRHPSQLYEALLEGAILFIIMLLLIKKYQFKWRKLNSSVFLIFYGSFRIFVEFFREPDVQIGYIFNHITMGQILSLPLVFAGFYILIKSKKEYGK